MTAFLALSLATAAGLPLGEALGCLAGALTNPGCALGGALSNLFHGLTGPFADLTGRLPRTLADVLHRALGAFANILDRLAGLADEMASTLASLFHGVTDTFEQLGVAIERGEYTLEDQADVVESRFQQSLGLDALDLQIHFAQADVGADADLHEIAHLRHNRHLCPQVVDLNVDLVDLDDWDVEEDVRTVGKLVRVDDRVIGKLAP